MKVVLEAEDYLGEVEDIAPISTVKKHDFSISEELFKKSSLITFKFGGKYKDFKNRHRVKGIHEHSHPEL